MQRIGRESFCRSSSAAAKKREEEQHTARGQRDTTSVRECVMEKNRTQSIICDLMIQLLCPSALHISFDTVGEKGKKREKERVYQSFIDGEAGITGADERRDDGEQRQQSPSSSPATPCDSSDACKRRSCLLPSSSFPGPACLLLLLPLYTRCPLTPAHHL